MIKERIEELGKKTQTHNAQHTHSTHKMLINQNLEIRFKKRTQRQQQELTNSARNSVALNKKVIFITSLLRSNSTRLGVAALSYLVSKIHEINHNSSLEINRTFGKQMINANYRYNPNCETQSFR